MILCLQANQPQQNKINSNAKKNQRQKTKVQIILIDFPQLSICHLPELVRSSVLVQTLSMPFLPGQELGPCGLCCAGGYVLLCFPTMKKPARVQPANFTISDAASLHPRFIDKWCHLFFFFCSMFCKYGQGEGKIY